MLTSLLSPAKQQVIEDFIIATKHLPGALAELGVYRGGNALRMAKAGAPKKIHLFDTFKGIPEESADIDVHKVGEFGDTDLDKIKEAFRDVNAEFHIGLFPDTGLNVEGTFSVVHLDADQYSTTLHALNFFYTRLDVGGVIILDDYRWPNCPGIEKALDIFLQWYPEKLESKVENQAFFFKTGPAGVDELLNPSADDIESMLADGKYSRPKLLPVYFTVGMAGAGGGYPAKDSTLEIARLRKQLEVAKSAIVCWCRRLRYEELPDECGACKALAEIDRLERT